MSDGHQVLHFRPARWDRWCQTLEVTLGEVLTGQDVPLLKHRREMGREDAIRLWHDLKQQGWRPCTPQWVPPAPTRPYLS